MSELTWADESMAMHWIDRYAAGIDGEPQMDRILDCVRFTHPPLAAQPPDDVREALRTLVSAVENMRVPQNIAEAALQVELTIGPALKNAQRALSSPTPPDDVAEGMVVVPREPTEAMARAFYRDSGEPALLHKWFAKAYADMIAAAPASLHPEGVRDAVLEEAAWMSSGECIALAQEALQAWADKPHNKRWFKRIDGTPILNDLPVVIAMFFGAQGVRKRALKSGSGQ